MRLIYCSVLLLLALPSAISTAQTTAPAVPREVFTVFVRGQPIGSEEVGVTRAAEGWTITSSGRLGAPFNILNRRLVIRYGPDWKPLELTLDAAVGGEPQSLHTTIHGTSALNEISQNGQATTKSDTIAPDAVLLPNPFFGAYEAVTARLAGVKLPADLRAYVPPQAEVMLRVSGVSDERIQAVGRTVPARRYQLTFLNPAGPVAAEIWVDDSGRFLRLVVPGQSLEVVRQELASVSSRVERTTRAGDEQVTIPSSGFGLAATISKPAAEGSRRLPAIVLVGGTIGADRDETAGGISVFGHLADALADGGFAVVRYDKRGVGQSGGRPEAATMADYAEDARAAVKYLSSRKDIDRKRIALAGYGDGGSVALLAASRDDRVKALVLIATPGTAGADLVLEQQRHALDRSKMSDSEKETAIDLQQSILQAAATGTGWEGVPPEMRRRADTPWYRSFIMFDPAGTLKQLPQPILIVQGALDTQVPLHHANRLAELARGRKGKAATNMEIVPGVNHLLVSATTGETDEYSRLTDRTLSPAVTKAIVEWLQKMLPATAGS